MDEIFPFHEMDQNIKHMRRIPMRIMLNPSENYLKSHKVSNESK